MISDQGMRGHTHQRGKLRGTSPVSDMELAPSRAWNPGLVVLIHDPRWKKGFTVECDKMRDGGVDPMTGETGVASKGNRTEIFGSQTDRKWMFCICADDSATLGTL